MSTGKALWIAATCVVLLALAVGLAGCGGSAATGGSQGTTGQVTEASLGVPIYPGAKQMDMTALRQQLSSAGNLPRFSSGANVPLPGSGANAPQPGSGRPDFSGQGGQGFGLGNATTLWTADATAKVTSWYRGKLKGKSGFQEVTPQLPNSGSFANRPMLGGTIFTFKSGNTTKMVTVGQSWQGNGGTTITVRDGDGVRPPAGSALNQNQPM